MASSRPYGRAGWRAAWPYFLPAALLAGIFLAYPIAGTLRASLFRDVSFMPRTFAGARNFLDLAADPGFRQAAVFTGLFALVSVPLETALGLALALVLHARAPGRAWLRAALLLPWAVPATASARIFELVYQVHGGLANRILLGLGLSDRPIAWLGSAPSAFAALVLADAWKTAPFAAILFLAGLSALPPDVHRQARIDGAHFAQIFRRVTWPLLQPTLAVVVLFRAVDALRVFDLNYTLTGGGPGGATTSLSLLAYRRYLAGDFGSGAAVSMILFAAALLFAIPYARRARGPEGP